VVTWRPKMTDMGLSPLAPAALTAAAAVSMVARVMVAAFVVRHPLCSWSFPYRTRSLNVNKC
jgi:hypothetical protein